MEISANTSIVRRKADGTFFFQAPGLNVKVERSDSQYNDFQAFYNRMCACAPLCRDKLFEEILKRNEYETLTALYNTTAPAPAPAPVPTFEAKKATLVKGIEKLMKFFSEFDFVPSFRFTNTLAFRVAAEGLNGAKDYVSNYFRLMDSSYALDVSEKMKSPEFKGIVDTFIQYGAPASAINTRLKVYFGSAGTGKTTLAQQESENRCIVCNSSMLPADLMEDFIFKDGKPDFNPSLLWNCMEEGKKIVLDEINLLPFDSLRFLQGIADGKTEFYYKNRPVHIHDGFQIIGTMNLSLGGMVYGLPEPLVDRCADTKEFCLTANQLAKAILGEDGE